MGSLDTRPSQVVRRAPARGPDDVSRRDPVVERRHFLAAGEIEDQLCRLGADCVEVLANARQRRGYQRSRLGVVEADDRLIAGKHQSSRFQDPHDSDGVHVGPGDDRARWQPCGQHGLASLGTTALDVVSRPEQQAIVGVHTVTRKGLAVGLVAFAYVALSQVADKGDTTVSVIDEMIYG